MSHETVLNLDDSVGFCVDSHLSPQHFVPEMLSPIRTDLDFLLAWLSHIDSGLTVAFRGVQIQKRLRQLRSKQAELFTLMKYIQQDGYLQKEGGTQEVSQFDCYISFCVASTHAGESVTLRKRHFEFGFSDDMDGGFCKLYSDVLGTTEMVFYYDSSFNYVWCVCVGNTHKLHYCSTETSTQYPQTDLPVSSLCSITR